MAGDVKTLLDDIQELKPTIFPAVPRVLNKVYDKVNAQLDAKPFVVKVSAVVSQTCPKMYGGGVGQCPPTLVSSL